VGAGTPELLCLKSDALQKLGRESECKKLMIMAFAGFMLLGEKQKATDVLIKGQKEFGLDYQLYGANELIIPPGHKTLYTRGDLIGVNSLGDMIRIMRKRANLSLKELSIGICSIANLGKIEKNEIQGNVHFIEPILQRLGRDPLLYCNFFLSREDFEARELRDEIRQSIGHMNYEKAEVLLEKLITFKAYNMRANLQFVKMIKIGICENQGSESLDVIRMKYLEALHITCPQFDEDKISHYAFTFDEACIVSNLAGLYMAHGDNENAVKLHSGLVENIINRYVDEFEMAQLYAVVMFNYSTCLGRLNQRNEALKVIEDAEVFERNHGRLLELPSLAFNKAYNLMKLGDKDIALAYFTLAYYGSAMFTNYGDDAGMSITKDVVLREYGLEIML
jgi:transcriptional regulator with XRE-family HTH domain